MMIKFLLLFVLCNVVLAESGIKNADDFELSAYGSSLLKAEELSERSIRDAKNKKGTRKDRNKKKALKRTEKKKGGKRNNKKVRKQKPKRRNKSKKSLKKSKRNKRRNKKRSNKKKNNTGRNSKQNRSETSCTLSSECISKAELYMKTLKDKISNYEKQKKRIDKQIGIAKKKVAKKDEFAAVLNTLVTATGGNKTALVCDGSTSSDGASQLNELSTKLESCGSSIEKACNASFPALDASIAAGCMEKMDSFSSKVSECIAKSGEDACTCWTDPSLAMMQEDIKSCSLSTEAANSARGTRACIATFSECRQSEDLVGRYIFGCREGTTELKKKLKQLTKNKNVLEEVQEKIKSLSSRKATNRAEECSSVISISNLLLTAAGSNPSDSNIQVLGAQILEIDTAVTCTVEEKADLVELDSQFTSAVTIMSITILQVQESISDVSGTTVPASDILTSTDASSTSSSGTGSTSSDDSSTMAGGSSSSGDSSSIAGSMSSEDSSNMAGTTSSEDSSGMAGSTSSGDSSSIAGSMSSEDSSNMAGSTASGDSSSMAGSASSGGSSMMSGSTSSGDSSMISGSMTSEESSSTSSMMSGSTSSGDSSMMSGSTSSGDSSMMSGSMTSEESSSTSSMSGSSGESSTIAGSMSSTMMGSTSSGDSSSMDGTTSSDDSSSMDDSSSTSSIDMSGSTESSTGNSGPPSNMTGSDSTSDTMISTGSSLVSESGNLGNSSMSSSPDPFMGSSVFFNMSSTDFSGSPMFNNMTSTEIPMLNMTTLFPPIINMSTLFPPFNMSSNNMTAQFNMSLSNLTMNSP